MNKRQQNIGTLRTIFLIGFSGSGKSTVGPLLARRLNAEFIDTDTVIEEQAGRTIAHIFAVDGEAAFRSLETDLIRQLAGNPPSVRVIALGGGAFQNPGNRELIAASGITVYLQCTAREIYRRLKHAGDRPLLNARSGPVTMETITGLLATRREAYRMADLTVATSSRTAAEAAEMIETRIRKRYGTHQS